MEPSVQQRTLVYFAQMPTPMTWFLHPIPHPLLFLPLLLILFLLPPSLASRDAESAAAGRLEIVWHVIARRQAMCSTMRISHSCIILLLLAYTVTVIIIAGADLLSPSLHPPSSILNPPSSIFHPPASILHPPFHILLTRNRASLKF